MRDLPAGHGPLARASATREKAGAPRAVCAAAPPEGPLVVGSAGDHDLARVRRRTPAVTPRRDLASGGAWRRRLCHTRPPPQGAAVGNDAENRPSPEWQRAFARVEALVGGRVVASEKQERWRPAWF